MSKSSYHRLLYLDQKFSDKFNCGEIYLWPYCRQYLYKKLTAHQETTGNSGQLKYKFSALLSVLFSHFRIKRTNTVFLSSNRIQIESLLAQFRNEIGCDENYITLFQLGFEETTNQNTIYVDLPKLIVRLIGRILGNRSLSRYMKFVFFEGYLYFLYYKLLFFFLRPKNVYFINWYDHYPALLALRNEVKTTEIQHGIIHEYHTGYRFGEIDATLMKIPDDFAFWDDKTNENVRLPSEISHFTFERKPFNDSVLVLDQNVLVIISQHSIRKSIDSFIPIIISKYHSYSKIVYRIHPKDRAFKEEITRSMSQFEKVIVEGAEDAPFESYLCESNVFFGVFSTLFKDLIQEGYNCVVLDLPEKNRIEKLLTSFNVICLEA